MDPLTHSPTVASVDCGCYEWITAEVSTNTSPFGYGQDASRISNTGLLGPIDSAIRPIETVTFQDRQMRGMSPTAIAPSQSIDQLDGNPRHSIIQQYTLSGFPSHSFNRNRSFKSTCCSPPQKPLSPSFASQATPVPLHSRPLFRAERIPNAIE